VGCHRMQKEGGGKGVIGISCATAEFDRRSDTFMRQRLCSGYGRAIDLHIVSIAGWTATVVLGGDIQKASAGFLDWWIALFKLLLSESVVFSLPFCFGLFFSAM
jgi:hypothetical protein